jgi:thiamine biosynthesis lipoprotein
MGTTVSLDLCGVPPSLARALADETFGFLREIDAQFSTYRADSEVCSPSEAPSPRMQLVLDRCSTLWTITQGYFDAYATGRLDPSGFVKGWAVQVASDRLIEAGAVNHCLNAGGDLIIRGLVDGRPWRIGVRHPFEPDQVCCVVSGADLAVATSGVYERGHHVVDPFTGTPARGLRSVTVTGPDLGDADAYATAAVAMGMAGLDWLAILTGYECAVVTDEGRLFTSPGFPSPGFPSPGFPSPGFPSAER